MTSQNPKWGPGTPAPVHVWRPESAQCFCLRGDPPPFRNSDAPPLPPSGLLRYCGSWKNRSSTASRICSFSPAIAAARDRSAGALAEKASGPVPRDALEFRNSGEWNGRQRRSGETKSLRTLCGKGAGQFRFSLRYADAPLRNPQRGNLCKARTTVRAFCSRCRNPRRTVSLKLSRVESGSLRSRERYLAETPGPVPPQTPDAFRRTGTSPGLPDGISAARAASAGTHVWTPFADLLSLSAASMRAARRLLQMPSWSRDVS